MIYALLFLILFALLFPKALKLLLALLLLGGIVAIGEVHANDIICEKAAAYQVSGEPGIHECLSHQNMSTDCDAVLRASMNKRIHECQVARKMLRKHEHSEYYTPGQMYSGHLGAHIGPGPHVMAPYTGW